MNTQFGFLKSTVKLLPLKHVNAIDLTQPLHPIAAFFNGIVNSGKPMCFSTLCIAFAKGIARKTAISDTMRVCQVIIIK
ncbi:hypothetical protein BU683_11845, partial [Staphylococcus chromogenes]